MVPRYYMRRYMQKQGIFAVTVSKKFIHGMKQTRKYPTPFRIFQCSSRILSITTSQSQFQCLECLWLCVECLSAGPACIALSGLREDPVT